MRRVRCPRCQTPYAVPEERTQNRVRCAGCGREFVPDLAGFKTRQRDYTGLLAAGGFLVVALLLFLIFGGLGSSGEPEGQPPPLFGEAPGATLPPSAEPAAATPSPEDPAVRVARSFVESVTTYNRERLERTLAFADVYASASDGERSWIDLSAAEQAEFRRSFVDSLIHGERRGDLADREPVEAAVVSGDDARVQVRLLLKGPVAAEPYLFRLVREGAEWRVAGFEKERIVEPPAPEPGPKRPTLVDQVVLSDGSVVIEDEIRPMEHLEDTPSEARTRIDALIATLVDPNPRLGMEIAEAREKLIEIGRPAIPRLLNALHDIPADGADNLVRLNLVNKTLEAITGFSTSFAPQLGEGSITSASPERLHSGLKQWFAWWKLNHKKFEERVDGADPFADLQVKPLRGAAAESKPEPRRPPP